MWGWSSCFVHVSVMLMSFCSDVIDRVDHDVVDVVVGEGVDDFASAPVAGDEVGRPQHPKMLRDQRLGGAGGVDEFVHAARGVDQRTEHRKPQGMGDRLEQAGALDEDVVVRAR